jgi:hypothetical protein
MPCLAPSTTDRENPLRLGLLDYVKLFTLSLHALHPGFAKILSKWRWEFEMRK